MNILGFSNEHDAGIAFVHDGRVIYAVNEERFSRVKYSMDDPAGAMRAGTALFPAFAGTVDFVAVASTVHIPEGIAIWTDERTFIQRLARVLTTLHLDRLLFGTMTGVRLVVALLRLTQLTRARRLRSLLRSWGVRAPPRKIASGDHVARLTFIDHHRAHAASAYFTSPWERALVVTLDSHGDGFCSRVFLGEHGTLRELHRIPFFHSPGHYYLYVTLLLGFQLGREGKVTGLAARGDHRKTLPIFRERIVFSTERCTFVNRGFYRLKEMAYLKERLKKFSREDIAAGIQKHLEDVVTAYIAALIERFVGSPVPVALAGGVFANVKLNQRINELPGVTGVYIYPHMGDGGLAAGAAIALEAQQRHVIAEGDFTWRHPLHPQPLTDVFLGPSFTEEEIETALKGSRHTYRRSDSVAREVAEFLRQGKVVAVFRGRMEYGPRALGNRSILCQATDPSVNDWLNRRLRRNEFMPFAPILRKEHVGEYFEKWQPCEKALEFMTITLNASNRCREEAPAIVHVDGTARPQVVLPDAHPFMDEVLREYERLTGLRILINTSFNIHEEPIVCTPADALRAFCDGSLDVLVMESFVTER